MAASNSTVTPSPSPLVETKEKGEFRFHWTSFNFWDVEKPVTCKNAIIIFKLFIVC